jgi:Zn-dependent protease/CBS domain-containing protein
MNGFRLGRFFGIDLHIDWSWLLIFALVSWSLNSMFREIHPEWTALAQWGLALLGALLFFISVLAHELAHSIMARARGIPVKNITLFLFGGVSNIQKEPTSPMAELLIAIVGPLTSFLLGGIFLVLGIGGAALGEISMTSSTGLLPQLGPLNTMFMWLGSVNILLGIFNLIPGFPLDGGRVLRSILWAITDDVVKATRWASVVGQIIAWLLVLAGVFMLFGIQVPLLGGGIANGMWIIFIGWFLQNAAVQNYQKAVVQDILGNVPVEKIMNPDVPVVPADIKVDDLVEKHIMKTDNQAFIVFDEDKMVGLVSIDDVRKLSNEERQNETVRDIMTPSKELVVVAPNENAAEALDRLQNRKIRQLPVVNGNRIVGLLRRKDILRWLELQSQTG